ncbi:MAG: hypothetical protein ACYSTJ_10385, partial [Planctomycetota bacterium]
MATDTITPPPKGFVLDASTPPPGFVLDEPTATEPAAMSKPSSGTWPYVAAGMGGFSPRITRETIPEPPAFLKKFYGEVPQAVGGEVGALAGGTA